MKAKIWDRSNSNKTWMQASLLSAIFAKMKQSLYVKLHFAHKPNGHTIFAMIFGSNIHSAHQQLFELVSDRMT